MEKKNGKMTLDKLARMMAEGFEEITAKVASKKDLENLATKEEMRVGFGVLEERFDRVEHRLGKVEHRVEEVRDILESEEKQVLSLQKRVGTLERTVKAISK